MSHVRRIKQCTFLVKHLIINQRYLQCKPPHINTSMSTTCKITKTYFLVVSLQEMGEVFNQTGLRTTTEIQTRKQSSKGSQNNGQSEAMSPTLRFRPMYNGSILYDSYELQAVTKQINKGIQGSKVFSTHYLCSLRSPFYRQQLNRIYKESTNTPKRILCSRDSCKTLNNQPSNKGTMGITRGVVTWMWKKVKHGFMRNRQRNELK